jgi:hypothetical protein
MQTKSFHRKINSQQYQKYIRTEAKHQLFVSVHAATSATSINSTDHSRTLYINFTRSLRKLHTMSITGSHVRPRRSFSKLLTGFRRHSALAVCTKMFLAIVIQALIDHTYCVLCINMEIGLSASQNRLIVLKIVNNFQ